ncbi:MAG: hypothetical protein HRU70_04025 [Phycisphaeraceae bacterium]|nr:MAG: hypothetical protein HRU70_04025 [Phycisphaeraceae bacterium]
MARPRSNPLPRVPASADAVPTIVPAFTALGESLRRAPTDHRAGLSLARHLATAWSRALPLAYRGVEIAAILRPKLIGYDAGLFTHAVRALRASHAAREVLSSGLVPDPRGHAPDSLAGAHLLDLALGPSVPARAAGLRDRYPAHSSRAGFVPREFEVRPRSLGDAPPRGCRGTLVVLTSPNYANPLGPVADALRRRGEPVSVLRPCGMPVPPSLGGDATDLESLLTPDLVALRDHASAWIARAWEDRQGLIASWYRPLGVDLWPLVERDLRRAVLGHAPTALMLIELAHRLAAGGVRRMVAARLRRVTELSLAYGFRAAGVPVSIVIHGHVSADPALTTDSGDFSPADAVCCWNHGQAWAVAGSPDAPHPLALKVTGNPAFDRLTADARATDRVAARAELARVLHLDPSAPWFLHLTQPITGEQHGAVARAVLSHPRAVLLVKPHPAETRSPDFAPPPAQDRVRVMLPGAAPLHRLLVAADVSICYSSTTNLESLLAGTPVITAALTPGLASRDRSVALEAFGLPIALSESALAGMVGVAAEDPAALRAGLEPAVRSALDHLCPGHGEARAADRVASLILGLHPRRRWHPAAG